MSQTKPRSPRNRTPKPVRLHSRRDRLVGVAVLGTVISVIVAVIIYGAISTHDQQLKASRAPATTLAPTTTTIPLTPVQREAAAWSAQVTSDYAQLVSSLQPLLVAVQAWETNTGSSAKQVAADVAQYTPDFQNSVTALDRQAPLALAPQAIDDYRSAADLYLESIRVVGVAAAQPPGSLDQQLQLSSTRIRELGDRVYDQATVLLKPYTQQTPPTPGVTFVQPLDVPVWSEVGLSPGPPLDTATPATPNTSYQQTRPQEPFAQWQAQVQALGLPTAAAEATAIQTGDGATLRSMSDVFNSAALRLTADPDPSTGRSVGTRLRLGLLVDAEATRTAEEAALLGTSPAAAQLRTIAATLAVSGDQLWDPQLGPRSTGLQASL